MEYKSIGYKKIVKISVICSIILALISSFVFADETAVSDDKIYNNVLNILVFIQKYSWPIVTLVFIYAIYQYYVIGSEVVEHKVLGRRLIVGVAIFMVIVQSLPLIYSFLTIK